MNQITHNFEYVLFNPSASLVPKKIDPIADAVNFVRINVESDSGISRKEAVVELGLNNTMIKRQINEYNIDYLP
ncbi:hypothetical protein AO067_20885 [Pseudomonas viridiflava ICMP 13104]|uniref:Uncharacterized protein n=1 Tax=Pseudomonas viridiflava ICMP 13104 TaxID=1198305 RepID=A0A0W0IBY5_PSEVI|nr:hypothetical protein AO067_20885 [Pseudomonas viridiflava ICMP 13104]